MTFTSIRTDPDSAPYLCFQEPNDPASDEDTGRDRSLQHNFPGGRNFLRKSRYLPGEAPKWAILNRKVKHFFKKWEDEYFFLRKSAWPCDLESLILELLQEDIRIFEENSCPPDFSSGNNKFEKKINFLKKSTTPNWPLRENDHSETRRFGQCDFWIFQELIFLTRVLRILERCWGFFCKTQLRCRTMEYHGRGPFLIFLQDDVHINKNRSWFSTVSVFSRTKWSCLRWRYRAGSISTAQLSRGQEFSSKIQIPSWRSSKMSDSKSQGQALFQEMRRRIFFS